MIAEFDEEAFYGERKKYDKCWMCGTEMIVRKACGELRKKFTTMLLCDAPGCGARKGYEKKEDV